MRYDPTNWYWLADDARVFASARQIIVAEDDAEYLVFIQSRAASQWPRDHAGAQTDAALQAVLDPYNIFVTLQGYTANARYNRAGGGLTITSISAIPFTSDPTSRNALYNSNEYVKITPGSTVNWKLSDGSFVVMNGGQLTTAATEMATFVQDCFDCENATVAGIADGTITTHAQIDAAFDAVSNISNAVPASG